MTPRVAITHRIEQRFSEASEVSTHWLRLRPAPHTAARVTAYSLSVDAEPHFINWLRDPFENHLARLDLPEPVRRFAVEVEVIADLESHNPFDFLTEPYAAEHPFDYPAQLAKELAPYLQLPDPGPRLAAWIAQLDREPCPTVERFGEVNQSVHETFRVIESSIPEGLDPERVLESGEASPWDLAWLLTLALRHLGLAARFVCGYRLHVTETPGGIDTVALHTWSEAYLPGAGWVGLDPAAGLLTAQGHIPLACTPDPMRARPIVDSEQLHSPPAAETLRIRRLVPAERTWPYSDLQWSEIRALGQHVERDLGERGVAISTGVSFALVVPQSLAPDVAPEWTHSALGASKRAVAETLLCRILARLAPRGVPQSGQGEWFAGEPLPRWRLGGFFRADGVPICRDPARLDGRSGRALDLGDAYAFATALAKELVVGAEGLVAAYEDPLHELWRSGRGVDVAPDEDLRDPGRRSALAERLSTPASGPTGYVLPLCWDPVSGGFRTGSWVFRRSRLYLAPGRSPLGHRLPLRSLVKDPDGERDLLVERSLVDGLAELPLEGPSAAVEPPALLPPEHPPRTAVCIEPRDGALYVFVPPLAHLEHYLALVACIEAAARSAGVSVVLEGYEPPEDPRLLRLSIEPEPGVLRVTLPQTVGFASQLELLEIAYGEARGAGLAAERITDDGDRLPPGSGGRLSLGGRSALDSPFLTRPPVLCGLIAYFQRHPALSYFFAGRMVGDAGPAPRPDEGRDEALYELSIALSRLIAERASNPWDTDRVLRHLLTDPKGDLERAEIRIDHLYSPESASQRLGRIQIGAFETAPEERIAALQVLLVLGLIGRFARVGDTGTLTRFESALHDRFMLPHVLWEDLSDVVADLRAVGYPFQLEWFEPIRTLRFPLLGRVQIRAIGLELHAAHEPWPLLAEEVSGGSVARFLDVATDRLQVRLSGLTAGRHVLICNEREVPIRPTRVHGEAIAGVRYKVWNPPATLHPTHPPVEALVFDLLDTWTGRILGGCTYYPRSPRIFGPIGSPTQPERPEERGERPLPPLPRFMLPSPQARRGRFVPRGSGLESAEAPPAGADARRPYLLDLTRSIS